MSDGAENGGFPGKTDNAAKEQVGYQDQVLPLDYCWSSWTEVDLVEEQAIVGDFVAQ
jgi:hypothetical protein